MWYVLANNFFVNLKIKHTMIVNNTNNNTKCDWSLWELLLKTIIC